MRSNRARCIHTSLGAIPTARANRKAKVACVRAIPDDPHDLLEIPSSADDKQVKRAYRKLALRFHPDVNKDELATLKFKKLREAYELLMGKGQADVPGRRKPFGGNWEFHDWYWSFSIKQRQRRSTGTQQHSAAAAQAHKPEVQSQLERLKHRAAARRHRSTSSPDASVHVADAPRVDPLNTDHVEAPSAKAFAGPTAATAAVHAASDHLERLAAAAWTHVRGAWPQVVTPATGSGSASAGQGTPLAGSAAVRDGALHGAHFSGLGAETARPEGIRELAARLRLQHELCMTNFMGQLRGDGDGLGIRAPGGVSSPGARIVDEAWQTVAVGAGTAVEEGVSSAHGAAAAGRGPAAQGSEEEDSADGRHMGGRTSQASFHPSEARQRAVRSQLAGLKRRAAMRKPQA